MIVADRQDDECVRSNNQYKKYHWVSLMVGVDGRCAEIISGYAFHHAL